MLLLICSGCGDVSLAQNQAEAKYKKASKKVVRGLEKNDTDTLAQGYFDLGDTYYQKGELEKSEANYQKSKDMYEKLGDAEGIAKSSRALGRVQEDLHKNKEAIKSYNTAQENSSKTGDMVSNIFNGNDIQRLLNGDSVKAMEKLLQDNIDLGIKNKDSNEIVANYSRMAELNRPLNTTNTVNAFSNAYRFSKNKPEQALRYNQLITDVYLKEKNFDKAIQTKKLGLNEFFVQNSTETKAREINSLADIYLQKKDDTTATRLLMESYQLSVQYGHTLEAKKSLEKLDSIYQQKGQREKSLVLHQSFVAGLPAMLAKDSSLMDSRNLAETEEKIKTLETEKLLKDELIQEKSLINYWLIASVAVLVILMSIILYTLKKIKIKNKKIALQSLRREMNPHFIFNSLNSINQFISTNNELEANRYLTKFSTLMRRVMENSKEDFVSFANEIELLRNYLDLEKSRFPEKFDYSIDVADSLYQFETLYLPGMLIQPYLENAVWHGLRYIDDTGYLRLSFAHHKNTIVITIEDNGIGIAGSKKAKTVNQQKQSGRGISNTLERIRILNELYHQRITCSVEDKPAPEHGVLVKLSVPLLKTRQHED
ncbi:MAG: histidine kinase [Bacteroidota bacterium]